jgi:molybdate/tungstate transport system substrate-binding protein
MKCRIPIPALALGLLLAAGCDDDRRRIIVVHADSLTLPFTAVKKAFEEAHPGVEVALEPLGSVVACRKLQSGAPCDVIALADPALFDEMLAPQGLAEWSVGFATTEIVIIKSTRSRFNAEITPDNWFEILARPGVKVGVADPAMDPCGYWTRLMWRLADEHYGRTEPGRRISEAMAAACRPETTRPDSQQLISYVVGEGGWDYAFVYRAQAEQSRIAFVPLPARINLGSRAPEDIAFYRKAAFEVPGAGISRTGRPVTFALGVPTIARNRADAETFVAFLLGDRGRELCREAGLPVPDRPWSQRPERLPEPIRPLVGPPPASG